MFVGRGKGKESFSGCAFQIVKILAIAVVFTVVVLVSYYLFVAYSFQPVILYDVAVELDSEKTGSVEVSIPDGQRFLFIMEWASLPEHEFLVTTDSDAIPVVIHATITDANGSRAVSFTPQTYSVLAGLPEGTDLTINWKVAPGKSNPPPSVRITVRSESEWP